MNYYIKVVRDKTIARHSEQRNMNLTIRDGQNLNHGVTIRLTAMPLGEVCVGYLKII